VHPKESKPNRFSTLPVTHILFLWLFLWTTPLLAETVHVVERGQTVSHLARMYGMSVQAICQANGVAKPNLIRIGQQLVIPEYDPFTGAVRGTLDRSTLGTSIKRRETALGDFYRKLTDLGNGGENQVRILVLGDSHIYADYFTGQLRRELQARFGDGGRGFVIPATHPRDPGQQGVNLTTSAEWIALKEWPADAPRPFGLPMKRHVALQPDAELSFTLADTVAANSVEVWYLAHPAGQSFTVQLDGGEAETVSCQAERLTARRWEQTPAGEVRQLRIRSQQTTSLERPHRRHVVRAGDNLWRIARQYDSKVAAICRANNLRNGNLIHPGQSLILPGKSPASSSLVHQQWLEAPVQILGVVLKSDRPGIVLDAAGMNGATAFTLLATDSMLLANQLQWRDPDLIVVAFGSNEAMNANLQLDTLAREYDTLLHRFDSAVPDAEVMFLAPPDMAKPPRLDQVYSVIETVAERNRAALWNQREAMGGKRSVYLWLGSDLFRPDTVHATRQGYELLAGLLVRGLLDGVDGVGPAPEQPSSN